MKPRICVGLTEYLRRLNQDEQIDAIGMQSGVEVGRRYLWNNTGGMLPSAYRSFDRWQGPNNVGVWARFLPCLEYTDVDYYAVFDDDTIPGENFLSVACEQLRQHGANFLVAATGVVFPHGSRQPRFYVGPNNHETRDRTIVVDVPGHAWVFGREVLLEWASMYRHTGTRYTTCGEDYMLAVAVQKLGGLCVVPPYPLDDKSVWGSTKLELGVDDVALYRQPGEEEKKAEVHENLVNMGWRTLHEIRQGVHFRRGDEAGADKVCAGDEGDEVVPVEDVPDGAAQLGACGG